MLKNIIKYILVFISILAVIFGIYFSYRTFKESKNEDLIFGKNEKMYDLNFDHEVRVTGNWDCLPADIRNVDGSACQRGIKDKYGNYFLLFYPNPKISPKAEKTGRVSVTGFPKSTKITTDGKKVNIFFVSKFN